MAPTPQLYVTEVLSQVVRNQEERSYFLPKSVAMVLSWEGQLSVFLIPLNSILQRLCSSCVGTRGLGLTSPTQSHSWGGSSTLGMADTN